MSSDTNQQFRGLFGGMMTQFMREAMSNGGLASILGTAPATATPPIASPSPLPTLVVPSVTPYTSTRALALPAAVAGHPLPSNIHSTLSTTQPMLGMPGLEIPLRGHSNAPRRMRDISTSQISETNAARRAAATAHLGPAGTTLQIRQRRRGPAIRGPVLHQGQQTSLEKVSSVNLDGVREIRLTHLVQAFQPGQEVVFYKAYAGAFPTFLDGSLLSFDYTLPEDTTVLSILDLTAGSMRTGRRQYSFGPIPSGPSTRHRHETLDLQPLVFVNLGKNRGDTGATHLRRESIPATLTLKDLFSVNYKNLFAIPTLSVRDGRFLLHSIVRYTGLTFIEEKPDTWPHVHTCLTSRQNRQFTEAVEMNFDDSDSLSDTSGGAPVDPQSDLDDDEDMPVTPVLTAATVPSTRHPLPSRRHHRAPVSSASNPATSLSTMTDTDMPAAPMLPSTPRSSHASIFPVSNPARISSTMANTAIAVIPIAPSTQLTPPSSRAPVSTVQSGSAVMPWTLAAFQAEPGPYEELFGRNDVPRAVYQTAGNGERLAVEAGSFERLAIVYIEQVRLASAMGDFTSLLAANRSFRVVNPDGSLRSFGPGPEREVIYTALNIFLKDPARWCLQTDEDRLSLGISMPLRLAESVPSSRLEDLRVFGALTALALISGHPPGLLSPALLQYGLNGCNLNALTPSFVASWNPELNRVALALQAAGPDGDLRLYRAELISVLNIQCVLLQPAVLGNRTSSLHNTIVAQLVNTALLGPDLHGHTETGAYCWGLDLPCANGFSFGKFARSYPGGTEFYLAHAWTSHISDFNSIEPYLHVLTPSASRRLQHFGPNANDLDPAALFTTFLQCRGIPCAGLLENGKAHFSDAAIQELDNINLPSFRPRMFCWAATGTPFLEPDPNANDPINVDFVLPGDTNYSDNSSTSAINMRQGTISFRTCSRVARIPMSKLVELSQATYPTEDEADFEGAIDNWLLLQILNAIGNVSML
ncbi:hypothetical protein FB451DRAFT_1173045 [Mycena latifolia]|nr:hypothetical protein FB451DRAFT_1173045 [Mycena latifolia]